MVEQWNSAVEQWTSDCGTVLVEQYNSDGGTVCWNRETVMVEQCGETVEE